MIRLEHSNGVVVSVPAEKAKRMEAAGWKRPAASAVKAERKTATRSKTDDKK